MKFYQISIDGPSGVGKSNVAKKLAQELGFLNINTGKIFRAIAWYINKSKLSEEEAIKSIEKNKNLVFVKNDVFFKEEKINEEELKTTHISTLSSEIAKSSIIRKFVLSIERKLSESASIVMEGRDIGTVVFPNAFLKIFLDADISARAKWRYEELKKLGLLEDKSYEDIKDEMEIRDKNDKNRKLDPLKKAEDAIEIDSSIGSIDDLVKIIKEIFLKKLKENKN